MIDTSRNFLDSVAGYVSSSMSSDGSNNNPYRLATIDPYYTAGLPHVIFDGETGATAKGYAWSSGYSPTAGDRVFMAPIGQTYIIGGKVTTSIGNPKYYPLTLQNGWTNYNSAGGYFSTARVTRTATGMVKVSGLVMGGTVAPGTVIANLPAPFRPFTELAFAGISSNVSTGINIHPNGDIAIGRGFSTSWSSLENIMFNNDPNLTWNSPTLVNGWKPYGGLTTYPQYTKDSLGRVWIKGVVLNSVLPSDDQTIFTLPAGYRPNTNHNQLNYGFGTFAYHQLLPTGDYQWRFVAGSTTNQYFYLDDSMFIEASVGGWVAPALVNGWINYGSTFTQAGYRKDADGVVHLRGLVKSGPIDGSAIFTLPPGFRPSATLLHATVSSANIARVDIEASTGNILAVSGSNGWFSLDGISFTAEA